MEDDALNTNSSHPSPSPPNLSTHAASPPSPPVSVVISPNVAYVTAELAVAVLSAGGNLLVCVAVGANPKLRANVTNYFLVSLAVADICVGAIAIPCAIMADAGLPRHDFYPCLLTLSVLKMFTQSSIFSLLAVAVERCVAVFMPLRYRVPMTPRNAALVILATWLLAVLIGLVPLMGWHKTPPASGHCFFVLVVDMTYMVYFNFFACVLTPLLAMFLIYARIFVAVRRQMKTATSLFLVLFLFTACWMPLHIINCFLLRCRVPLELLLAAIILSHANSAVNPFLYAHTMAPFRDAFKATFTCRGTTGAAAAPRGTASGDGTGDQQT